MQEKPIVFVITPFKESFLALYDLLKETFAEDFVFINGGDLDNQQNILKDIVGGIYEADVIIADLTGLNPNVFYELGLAHAMNKKVIIITQDIGDIPFDIKSYRANEYSVAFYKMPKFIEEIRKLLYGAMDGSIQYGNPVFDYLPDFNPRGTDVLSVTTSSESSQVGRTSETPTGDNGNEKGFLDYICDIQENSQIVTDEIKTMADDITALNGHVTNVTKDINRVKAQSGRLDINYARKSCQKLSEPMNAFSERLQEHVTKMQEHWPIIENGVLSLLDNPYTRNDKSMEDMERAMTTLKTLQRKITFADAKVDTFVTVLRSSIGFERKLNRAINDVVSELESYLSMTGTMDASIDRILSKGYVVLNKYSEGQAQ